MQQRALVVLLSLVALVNGTQLLLSVRRELSRPRPHWSQPEFDLLPDHLAGAEKALFLTDDRASANVRIHTCQFAILPTRLIVRHDWTRLFVGIDAGLWCIYDARLPRSIDEAKEKLRLWSLREKRSMEFRRLSPTLAVFRSRPIRPEKSR